MIFSGKLINMSLKDTENRNSKQRPANTASVLTGQQKTHKTLSAAHSRDSYSSASSLDPSTTIIFFS